MRRTAFLAAAALILLLAMPIGATASFRGCELAGTRGDDVLRDVGGWTAVSVCGRGGSDIIEVGGGGGVIDQAGQEIPILVRAGPGDDSIDTHNPAVKLIQGGPGDDTIVVQEGGVTIRGGPGNDTCTFVSGAEGETDGCENDEEG